MHARLGRRLLKCVKIDHDHVNRLNAVLGHSRPVRSIFATMQNAAVDFGMQRLDPPIEHLRKSSYLGNVLHGDSCVPQELGRAAGRN